VSWAPSSATNPRSILTAIGAGNTKLIAVRCLRRQRSAAVAGTLTALSLTHLAHGIAIVTAEPAWET
jgi:hypothetical protein